MGDGIEEPLKNLRSAPEFASIREAFSGINTVLEEIKSWGPIFDEMTSFMHRWTLVGRKKFTPAEFKEAWNSLDEWEQIHYVMSLISPK